MPISKIKSGAINDGAITSAKIADDAVDTADLADGSVTLAKTDNLFENTTFTGDDGIVLPKGTNAERPVAPVIGHFRFNEDANAMEQYTSDGWVSIATAPLITQSDIVSIDATGSTTLDLTISGSFFQSGAVVSFINESGTSQNADTTTFTNASELVATITRANFVNADEPYDLKVTNPSGLSYTIENYIRVDAAPAFTTAAGSLGTIEGGDAASELTTSTIAATDAEGETVTFTVNSGTLPTGFTLGNNGVISGTSSETSSSTVSSFDVRADDGTGNTTDATFTITVSATTYSYTLSNAWDAGSWNVAGDGLQTSVTPINDQSVASFISWDGDVGNNTTASSITGISSEFARYVTFYRGSDVQVSGASVWSGHNNGTDPLPAKDVAFYYSTDTTNGTDGTWTRITPKAFFAASATKASAASNYTGQRLSQVSSDHVVLSGNVQQAGTRVGGTNSLVYNYYGDMHDVIIWDAITCKGLRMDVRTKWGNGAYSNEKPHVALIKLLKGTNNDNTYRTRVSAKIGHIETLTDTQFYIDPATTANGGSWDGTTLQDLSANNFDFTPASDQSNNVPTISSTAGGTMEFGNGPGSLRKGATWSTSDSPDADTKHSAFTIGCWVKFSGSSSNQGIMFYGLAEPNNNRRHFFRTAFNNSNYHVSCGDSIVETDYWIDVIAPDGASNSSQTYINNNSSKWHLFISACDDQGNRLISWNGGRWMTNWHNNKGYALNSGSNYSVGFGGDLHNDNYATHSFGPMFYYKNVLPYEHILKEWNRHKTRFGW